MAARGNTEVKLLGTWSSPNVARARIALNLKEVQYKFLEEQFGTKSELLLKSNPVYKKMLVLIHDEKPVCESMIIVQHIDDVWAGSGTTLMSTDVYERAMHRFWTVYVDDKYCASAGAYHMAASGNPEVKLLGAWVSPFVARARIALNLKEVQFEFLEEQSGTKSELLLKSNPVYKKMPVLIHDGKPICESMIIVQYIDDVWAGSGTTLMPTDAYERAMHRFWTVYFDDKFYSCLFDSMMSQTEEAKAEAQERTVAALQLLEEAFVKISKGKPFFGGDTIGYLDIALGSFLGWIRAVEEMNGLKLLDDARIPLLCAWAENFCNNEAVRNVFPETVELVEFGKVLQSRYKTGPSPTK